MTHSSVIPHADLKHTFEKLSDFNVVNNSTFAVKALITLECDDKTCLILCCIYIPIYTYMIYSGKYIPVRVYLAQGYYKFTCNFEQAQKCYHSI